MNRGRNHPVAAADLLELDAGQIERAAFARGRLLRGFALLLDCAHPHIDAAGRKHELVAERDCAVEYGARDYRAAAGDGESAIDRVAEMSAGMLALCVRLRGGSKLAAKRVHSVAADGGYGKYRNGCKLGRREQAAHIGGDFGDALSHNAVGLGDDGDTARNIEQVYDMEMLDGLWHDAVIRCHDQHHVINAAYAREHIANETLVPRHVDETDGVAAAGFPVSEAQVDRNATRFLFRQAVGIDTRQCFDERRFAVVNMSCGRDDHSF